MSIEERRALHARAMKQLNSLVEGLSPDDLARPTPCSDWDLGALVAHLIGQHIGFARALDGETTTAADFAPRAQGWAASVLALNTAVASVAPDAAILLPEISPEVRFPAGTAVGFQLVDTVIHTWDVAASLGHAFRPEDDEVHVVLAIAQSVPAQASGTGPHLPFGPVLVEAVNDPWRATLARLGRRPDWQP